MVNRPVIDEFLSQKSLAIAGVSRDGGGFGNVALKELAAKGYDLHVVHPDVDTIAGRPTARRLADLAGKVGGVILVTPPAVTAGLVREAAGAGIRRVWIQQGAESADAIAFCEAQGMRVVHHECILMFAEPARWFHRAHRLVRGLFGHLSERVDVGAHG
jgi:predicted CoA-binding protein